MRQEILNQLRTDLLGIREENGYESTFRKSYKLRPEKVKETPSFFIQSLFAQGEPNNEGLTKWKWALQLDVYTEVFKDTDGSGLVELEIEKLASDISDCIKGLSMDGYPEGTESIDLVAIDDYLMTTDTNIIFTLGLQVIYYD